MKTILSIILIAVLSLNSIAQNNSWSSSSGDGSDKDTSNVDENRGFGELGYNLHFAMPIRDFYKDFSGNGYPLFTAHEFKYNYHWDVDGNVLPFIGGNIFLSTNNKSQIELPSGDYHLNNRIYSYHFKLGFLFTNDYNKTSPYIYGFYGNLTHRIRDELFTTNDFGIAESAVGSLGEISKVQSANYGLSLGVKSEITKYLLFDFGIMWMNSSRNINFLSRDLDLKTTPSNSNITGVELDYNTGTARLNLITVSVGLAFKFSSSGRSSGGYSQPINHQYNTPTQNRWWGSGWGTGIQYDRWGNPVNHWGNPVNQWGNPVNQWGNPYNNPNSYYNQPRTNTPSSGFGGSNGGRSGGSIQYDGKTPIGRK